MFFDLKNHLLYGLEPFCLCAQDEDMALCMAYEAYGQGCRFIMATPPDSAFLNALEDPDATGIPPRILDLYQSLSGKIRCFMSDMALGLGCEIHCSRHNIEDMIRHLHKGHLPTMNKTQYVLVSFPDNISREDLWFCLDRLDQAGYLPVLSHAQTIQTLKYDIHEILCLKGEAERDPKYKFRALFQIDTLSFCFSDKDPWSLEMLRCGVADMLATDARNTFSQPPHIQDALSSLSNICPAEYLDAISWHHAAGRMKNNAQ